MMHRPDSRPTERGIALVVVLLVVLAIAAIAAGAALLTSGSTLVNKYHARQSTLETVADAGIEQVRSSLNGNSAIYPDSNYSVIENGVTVYAADGSVIPNVKRWTYLGPTGVTTGQFGVFGSAIVVVQDGQGDQVIRRGEMYQASFAKYAYFTNIEGAIVFANGDQIHGPLFSNDAITINSSGATFWGPVTSAKTISGTSYGTFKAGYTQNAAPIAFPTLASLTKLQTQGTAGQTSITGTTSGAAPDQATTRIEFVSVDLNGDGNTTDPNEGFMRVYQVNSTSNAWWVTGDTTSYSANGGLNKEWNCGHVLAGTHTYFKIFRHHPTSGGDQQSSAITSGTNRQCYLGGNPILNDWTTTINPNDTLTGHGAFLASDSLGHWLPWPGTVSPLVTAARGTSPSKTQVGDANYLWPINPVLNTAFRGVVYVTGRVAVSGVFHGQVTVAATDNIIVASDITDVTTPGAVSCASAANDMLGLFSAKNVIVADNLLKDPITAASGSGSPVLWGPASGIQIQAVVLAESSFTVQNYGQGPTASETCGASTSGRGCLYLNGGVIQYQRGAVGTTGGTGYVKQYSYNACAATSPPPYFPTTGHFARGHYYEIDPTGFNVATYWQQLVPR